MVSSFSSFSQRPSLGKQQGEPHQQPGAADQGLRQGAVGGEMHGGPERQGHGDRHQLRPGVAIPEGPGEDREQGRKQHDVVVVVVVEGHSPEHRAQALDPQRGRQALGISLCLLRPPASASGEPAGQPPPGQQRDEARQGEGRAEPCPEKAHQVGVACLHEAEAARLEIERQEAGGIHAGVGEGDQAQQQQQGQPEHQARAVASPQHRQGEAERDLGLEHRRRPAEARSQRPPSF